VVILSSGRRINQDDAAAIGTHYFNPRNSSEEIIGGDGETWEALKNILKKEILGKN
jgi:hypothetical protein